MKQLLLLLISSEQAQNKRYKIVIEPELLWALYWGNQYSISRISKFFSCSKTVISKRLKVYNIPQRTLSECNCKTIIEPEILWALYWGNQYSIREIGKIFNRDKTVIQHRFKKYKIPKRTRSETIRLAIANKEKIIQPYDNKNLLTELYWGFDQTTKTMAKTFGVARNTIIAHMKKHQIPKKVDCIMAIERDGMGRKQCIRCKEWKSVVEFGPGTRKNEVDNLSSVCRFCRYIGESNRKRRKRSFSLTQDHFKKLLFGSCYYCNKPANPTNGVDRLDSSKGYVKGNVVSCCARCNRAKNNLSLKDFATEVIARYAWAKDYLKQHP